MSRILFLHSSVDGHTLRICEHLQKALAETGHTVSLFAIGATGSLDLPSFDKVVIGASIRYGRHRPSVARFIANHKALLDTRATAFFSVNLVARMANKNRPESNPYLRKFLAKAGWKPKHLAVFSGKLDYPRYRPLDRWMIRLIMWMTGGPTDPTAVVDFTDWQQVDAFAVQIQTM